MGIDGECAVLRILEEGTDVNVYARARRDLLAVDRRTLPPPEPNETLPVFSTLVQDMQVAPGPAGIVAAMQGPATAPWFLGAVVRAGTTLVARSHRWRAESGLRANSPAGFEHEVTSEMLEMAILHDRLNLFNLQWAELAIRRLQLHESAVAEDPQNPDYQGARHILGVGHRRAGALLAPTLAAHVSAELGREAAIAKERRKAKEARGAQGKAKAKAQGAPAPTS